MSSIKRNAGCGGRRGAAQQELGRHHAKKEGIARPRGTGGGVPAQAQNSRGPCMRAGRGRSGRGHRQRRSGGGGRAHAQMARNTWRPPPRSCRRRCRGGRCPCALSSQCDVANWVGSGRGLRGAGKAAEAVLGAGLGAGLGARQGFKAQPAGTAAASSAGRHTGLLGLGLSCNLVQHLQRGWAGAGQGGGQRWLAKGCSGARRL